METHFELCGFLWLSQPKTSPTLGLYHCAIGMVYIASYHGSVALFGMAFSAPDVERYAPFLHMVVL